MYHLIRSYMLKLTKEDISSFALKNNLSLEEKELNFIYDFVKKNWEAVLNNPDSLHLENYKEHFNPETYSKLISLISFYRMKYQRYLK